MILTFILFNGSDFWISAGVQTKDPNSATRVSLDDAAALIRVPKIDGFYPVLLLGEGPQG